jgi:hypothetical protein
MPSTSTRTENSRLGQYGGHNGGPVDSLTRTSGDASGPPWGILVTGLLVVGFGIVAWRFLGSDIRRYVKISMM